MSVIVEYFYIYCMIMLDEICDMFIVLKDMVRCDLVKFEEYGEVMRVKGGVMLLLSYIVDYSEWMFIKVKE